MDFNTFTAIAGRLNEDISVVLRGRHGIGKSEVVYQLADHFNLPVMERRLSQVTEGDVIGLPYKIERRDDKGELRAVSTRFLPLDWFVACMEKPHLIFLDEIDRASYEVQQAAFELILDRSIQGNKVHPDCRIYAAINGGPGGAMYNVNEMDPALVDRFWVSDLRPTVEEWLSWAKGPGEVIPEIVQFIRSEEKHLEFIGDQPEPGKVYPSRRSWKRLSNVLKSNEDMLDVKEGTPSLLLGMCTGFVGTEATSMFQQFLANRKKSFTADDVLDRFPEIETIMEESRVEEQNNMIEKIFDHSCDTNKPIWTKAQVENVRGFFKVLSNEVRMSMWDKLSQSECKRENARVFAHAINDILISFV